MFLQASELFLQRGPVLLQFPHVLFQGALMLLKQVTAFGERRIPLAAQLGKAYHLRPRHPSMAESDK